MKRILLLPLLLCFTITAFCQQITKVGKDVGQPSPAIQNFSPAGAVPSSPAAAETPVSSRLFEENIGITRFNPQTIASLGRRIVDHADGTVSAVWLHGLDEAGGWPGRGSAYNHFGGSEWGPEPAERIEATRSGYPSFARLADGTDVVLSHKNTSATQWFLTAHVKAPGETAWTEYELPSGVMGGPVWSKVATGGADGNTLHVIATAVNPAFGGQIYEGMTQHPLYYRSTDGGVTWDMSDVIIPGLDSTGWLEVGGENYNIDARGETVVVAVFDSWGDQAIFKSEDNGETWVKTIVHDFPLDKYDGTGYTVDDILVDTTAPNELAMLTGDGSGSVVLDEDGKVHVFFPWMWVYAEASDFFLFLDVSGVAYWNEDMGSDPPVAIADLQDIDGDDLFYIGGTVGDYRYSNASLTSFPSAGVDADNNLYMVYSGFQEEYISVDDQNYRHIFIVKSEDGGTTWTEPYDLINAELTEFPEFIEGAYPAIPAHIGNSIHLLYQQDFVAGPNTDNDNFMMHMQINKETFGLFSAVEDIPQLTGEVTLAPNPAGGYTRVNFELNETAEAAIQIVNMLGEQVYQRTLGKLPAGSHNEQLSLHGLASGIYFVQLKVGAGQVSKKIVVRE